MSQLTFVTGKGGVGKSRFSLLLAAKNPQSALAEAHAGLEAETQFLKIRPQPIYRFSREDLSEDFLTETLKIKTLAKIIGRSHLFQTLLSLAPNLYELLLLKKWLELTEEQDLIVDSPSTGHFLALFDAIQTAMQVFDGGSLRSIATEIDAFIRGGNANVVIVSLPERSALSEMDEIQSHLKKIYPSLKISLALNRRHIESDLPQGLDPRLQDLASLRPRLEASRIEGRQFQWVLMEGAKSL